MKSFFNFARPPVLVFFATASLAVGLTACSTAEKSAAPAEPTAAVVKPLPTTIEEAVKSEERSAENRKRDVYRHPVETLSFFGLQPSMTVLEISPSGGWYTEILAPYLASSGKFIAAVNGSNKDFEAWMAHHPEVAKKSEVVAFKAADKSSIVPDGSVDRVLTFRNAHNWMKNGNEKAAFQAFFKALKKGGILGVVEHRANPKSKRDPKAEKGYVREADVIKLAQSVGFKLDGKSEVNANPKDTKDYADGVWTLPPSLTLKEKDREKYLAIGESDRMTLRFVKR